MPLRLLKPHLIESVSQAPSKIYARVLNGHSHLAALKYVLVPGDTHVLCWTGRTGDEAVLFSSPGEL